ncbi:hypothetical protein SAMN06296241_3180 [Salinimicrobium sediminis]|uniref:Uncharacterized protein n=1 Tax=Salinimicrobium sediminis TaxID=1343891 RepID=A0A285XAY5_9FLAO|nr:hypothetical protein [Salinimicrobium sediminis]SOC81599.1 hypothetical protein SAMN06296241_3180 [Salinimicrobium sediminis]
MSTSYRNKIILTYRALLDAHEEIMERIINMGMTGEFAEINEVFQPGDSFKFDVEMFRDSKDQNLQLLLGLFDELEDVMKTLADLNGITEEELEDESI